MSARQREPIQHDWISKSLAGLLLGAVVAFACSGLFVQLNTGMPLVIRGQLAMWMVIPIWLGILSSVYFFSSGKKAWLWLGAICIVVLGSYLLIRFI